MQERLAGGRVAVGDHPCDVGLQGVEVVVVERFESVFVGGREFGPVCFEFGEPLREVGDAGRAGLFGHRLVFEGVEVAVEGVVGFA
ncbi:MAG TPA: hypothetical protein VFW41_03840 [Gaiellaceae bacterium]|nr:hypothetical protein [Gaiellaceae bacterium]